MSQRTHRDRPGSRGRQRHHNSYNRRRPTKQKINPQRFVKKAAGQKESAYTPDNSFADFDLHPKLFANLKKRGYEAPTAIQDQAIPSILEGRDLVGLANTGTGKTGAFLIPLIHKLAHDPKQQVVVIAPTRELALQIQDEFKAFAQDLNLYSALLIGGTSIGRQIAQLKRGVHAVIGTPGRMKDLLGRQTLQLDKGRNFVLDEVDRMVDMGFIKDIKAIISHLPKQRQSLFLAATTSPQVESIMRSFLHQPVKVTVRTSETVDSVEQDIVRIAPGENKTAKLKELLGEDAFEKVLVFGETKRGVERLSKDLNGHGFKAVAIHGNKSQNQRQRALRAFRDDRAAVMVATDVAARGLDIDDITHVINYDTPQTYDDYIHRIGRTGRAGRQGSALTFIG